MVSNEPDPGAVLRRLNTEYPGWRVWRSLDDRGRPAAWVASNRRRDSMLAPTLHAETPEKLEAQLQDPPRACSVMDVTRFGT